MSIKSILVFCGSATGNDEQIIDATKRLGQLLAALKMRLIYGGGSFGLMGILANEVLHHQGTVIGVIPEFMVKKELLHQGLTETFIVGTMHERKQKMASLCDAVVVLPGGIGTMEEFFEFYTWLQLQLHHKPIAIMNINGYYDFLILQMQEMVKRKFLLPINTDQVIIGTDVENVLKQLLSKVSIPVDEDFYDQVKKLG